MLIPFDRWRMNLRGVNALLPVFRVVPEAVTPSRHWPEGRYWDPQLGQLCALTAPWGPAGTYLQLLPDDAMNPRHRLLVPLHPNCTESTEQLSRGRLTHRMQPSGDPWGPGLAVGSVANWICLDATGTIAFVEGKFDSTEFCLAESYFRRKMIVMARWYI